MGYATKYLSNPPRVRVFLASPLSSANSTWTTITWSATDGSNYETMWTSGSRVSCKAAGRYLVTYQAGFAANSTGYRFIQVRKNSAGSVASGIGVAASRLPHVGSSSAYVTGAFEVTANGGDYFELFAFQSSGGALDINGGVGETFLSARWVAVD